MGSVAAAHGLNFPMAILDLSSPTRDQSPTHCVASQILNHWATREIHSLSPFFFATSSEFCYPFQDTPSSNCFLHFPLNPTRSSQQLICDGIKIHNLLFNTFATLLKKSSYSHDSFKANCTAQGRQNWISNGTSEINESLKGWDQWSTIRKACVFGKGTKFVYSWSVIL